MDSTDLSYSRKKILGKSLVLQSVFAKNTHVYGKYSGIAKWQKIKVNASLALKIHLAKATIYTWYTD